MWDVSLDFEEAVAWFMARLPISKVEFDKLDAAAKKRAFTVANVAQVRMVAAIQNSLTAAIKDGTTLDEWRKEQAPSGLTDAHLETVFRNNVQTAYAAGREKLASHPTVKRLRPYARFDAVMDARTTEDICRPLNGTVRPADDPWWDTHTPPLHHNCRSGKVSLTAAQAKREGITEDVPDAEPQDGWGARPRVDDFKPEQGDTPDGLWAAFEAKQQA